MKMNIAVTTRLSFKLMDEKDWQKLFELDQDPAVMQYLTQGKPTSLEDIKTKGIPRMLAYRNEQQGWGLWQVTLREGNTFIGWVLVRPMGFFSDTPDFSDIEVGWRFKQASWGKGYAIEAAQAICSTIEKQPQIKAISATALTANVGSIKIMKKLGMQLQHYYIHTDDGSNLTAALYSKPCS
jgi:RimJ/RimL family protein N-acetyltransferase